MSTLRGFRDKRGQEKIQFESKLKLTIQFGRIGMPNSETNPELFQMIFSNSIIAHTQLLSFVFEVTIIKQF